MALGKTHGWPLRTLASENVFGGWCGPPWKAGNGTRMKHGKFLGINSLDFWGVPRYIWFIFLENIAKKIILYIECVGMC